MTKVLQINAIPEYYSIAHVADILGMSKETLRRWDANGKLVAKRHPKNNYRVYHRSQLEKFEQVQLLFNSRWQEEMQSKPLREYRSLELFAGAGGLALGLERAGFQAVLLNEINSHACATLRYNRPSWQVLEGDISQLDFQNYQTGDIDVLSGGFPCQAFSYAGKKLGFEDTRGTLFFEFARAVQALQPKIFLAENVKGLLRHEQGATLATMRRVLSDFGYVLLEPRVLNAVFYRVPQKRERLFLIGIREDIAAKISFSWPSPFQRIMTVRDALKAGDLYPEDVPLSAGQSYPQRKQEILAHVPQGGYWRDLPEVLQREYMKASYFLGGGKTGMARRLAWDEPSLTLTTAPAQKQTERCHPEETRPLTIREYARIQTFPDDWHFMGSVSAQYKQIGNAVPVNLAHALGRALVRALNQLP